MNFSSNDKSFIGARVRPYSTYPIAALPSFLRSVYDDLMAHTQAPDALIIGELLATVSLACQGGVNVRRPNGPEIACSIWVLMKALTGERKTAVGDLILVPIREYEEDCAKKNEQEMSDYEIDYLAWKLHEKEISKTISKNAKRKKFDVNLSQELKEHKLLEPQKPKKNRLLYNDASPSAIREGLVENGLSMGIFSDEAQSVFDGQAFRDLAMINTLWSGGTLTIDRTSSPSFIIKDARLTMSLMVQPVILQKFMERKGIEARGTGMFARFLICEPISTQGFRLIDQYERPTNNLKKFNSKIKSIITSNDIDRDARNGKRKVLVLSEDAVNHWIRIYNEIETEMSFGASMFEIKDYASKLAENILRVAALFHIIEECPGDISVDILQRAATICYWYKDEFKRMFVAEPELPEVQLHAMLLEAWLGKHACNTGWYIIPKQRIVRYGPSKLRSKDKVDAALDVLESQGRLFRYFADKNGNAVLFGRTEFVNFTPIFSEYRAQQNGQSSYSATPCRF